MNKSSLAHILGAGHKHHTSSTPRISAGASQKIYYNNATLWLMYNNVTISRLQMKATDPTPPPSSQAAAVPITYVQQKDNLI
eukprot:10380172-Ditylum_brightwellii.AAC.1